MNSSYHHGDLRQAVLSAAAAVIARDGVEQLSLRSVAAELGVSHTAPRYHFGSREGVFTALAVEGYTLLDHTLEAAADRSFAEVGAAYVQFSVAHPGHFAVMHRPDLVQSDDPELVRVQQRTFARLTAGAGEHSSESTQDQAVAAIAAWSLVHGLAVLTLNGALDQAGLREQAGGDLPSVAVRAAERLFGESLSSPQERSSR